MSSESGDGIRPPSPESGQPDSGDQSDRIWPERPDSVRLAGSSQRAGFRPTLAREVGSRPTLAREARSRSALARDAGSRPALAGRIWPDPASLAEIRLSQIPTKLSRFRLLSQILAILAGIR
jgi:hypothetical protein